MGIKTTAVFDFDGTIVSKDTGYEFYKWLIRKSLIRTFSLFAALPVIAPLMLFPTTLKRGLNIACFIATVGQTQSLFTLRKAFIAHYFGPVNAVAFTAALEQIVRHQERGEKVLIISGCPLWLLAGVTKHIGIRGAKLIGSRQKIVMGAVVMQDHCFSSNKINMAREAGQTLTTWHTGYSDSTADIPFLNHCQQAMLINVDPVPSRSFEKQLTVPSHHLVWK